MLDVEAKNLNRIALHPDRNGPSLQAHRSMRPYGPAQQSTPPLSLGPSGWPS